MIKRFTIVVLLMTVFFQSAQAQQNLWRVPGKLPENVQMLPNLVYGQGGGRDLFLDLYLPKDGTPPYPVTIFIHGGGWKNGNKEMYRKHSYYLASRGIACVSISYRLSGEAKFPAAVHDSKCAVRWMRANSVKYNINPYKIAVAGGSAGGHLVGLVGTTGGIKEFEGSGGYGEFSSKPNLVISFFGVFDFTRVADQNKYNNAAGVVAEFLGGTYDEIPETYKLASPITYVDRTDPPFLLFHSTGDIVVPYEQSVEFKKVLDEAGVPAEISITVGSKHGYVHSSPHYEATLAQMEEFINLYFNK
ncbi:alpha/beta hydrolase fold domain-containing protein [candidate division KSB1 bacterium]